MKDIPSDLDVAFENEEDREAARNLMGSCHVWTALCDQGLGLSFCVFGSGHVFGLCAGGFDPLALMFVR